MYLMERLSFIDFLVLLLICDIEWASPKDNKYKTLYIILENYSQ